MSVHAASLLLIYILKLNGTWQMEKRDTKSIRSLFCNLLSGFQSCFFSLDVSVHFYIYSKLNIFALCMKVLLFPSCFRFSMNHVFVNYFVT